MALLEILTYPDSRLRKKSSPVRRFDHYIKDLLRDMADTMYDAPGVGLAAPQVGVNLRAIVIDISSREESASGLIELINPDIIYSEGQQIGEEGCLSIPGFVSEVKRKNKISVRAYNSQGEPFEIEAENQLSKVIQHEIDHINGILFIDRLSRLKRELLKRKIDRALKSENYAAF